MESETRLGRAWRTFLSCTNSEAEQPALKCSQRLLPVSCWQAREIQETVGSWVISPGTATPPVNGLWPAWSFYFQSTACLAVLGGGTSALSNGAGASELLCAVAPSHPLRAASWGHVLCQGRFGHVHPLTSPLAARPAPSPPGAVASPSHCLPSPPCRVYKNMEELRAKISSGIIAPLGGPAEKEKEPKAEKEDPVLPRDYDPLMAPPRQPAGMRAPSW